MNYLIADYTDPFISEEEFNQYIQEGKNQPVPYRNAEPFEASIIDFVRRNGNTLNRTESILFKLLLGSIFGSMQKIKGKYLCELVDRLDREDTLSEEDFQALSNYYAKENYYLQRMLVTRCFYRKYTIAAYNGANRKLKEIPSIIIPDKQGKNKERWVEFLDMPLALLFRVGAHSVQVDVHRSYFPSLEWIDKYVNVSYKHTLEELMFVSPWFNEQEQSPIEIVKLK